jgi:signal transduction histidine kinase
LTRGITADDGKTTTKVIHRTTNVVNAEVAFFSKTKHKADTYMNYTRPPLAIGLEPIKKAFLDAKNRGIYMRYITEINKDNLTYCRELMQIVHELRHLDGIKGNFMVSEGEYIAPLILFEHGKIAPQAFYSNVEQVVEHQQYIFENLWEKAIPAEERIREIVEGSAVHYETKVLRNHDQITNKIKDLLENSNELLVCTGPDGLQLGYDRFLSLGNEILARFKKGEHRGIKIITTRIQDHIKLVKDLLDLGIQIIDINNMPPMNFSLTGKEVIATIKIEGGEKLQSILVSNEPAYVSHFHSIFGDLWKSGIDAKIKIARIEEGTDFEHIEVIESSSRAAELYLEFVRSAQKEIMIIFPTNNAFLRQYRMGAVDLAKEAALQRNVNVRVLMPKHESTEALVQNITTISSSKSNHSNFVVGHIEQTILDTHATILIIDKKHSLVMEIRDDSKSTFVEAIGLSTYSNSKAGVLSYLSLIENLWLQSELYQQIKDSNTRLEAANERLDIANEQLRINNKMQEEFINIAAHELRTPIQPILGISQILRHKSKDPQSIKFLDIVIRNATRLKRLTEDILDVQKIDSRNLLLNKERLELNGLMSTLVTEYKNQYEKEKKITIEVHRKPAGSRPIMVEADKDRLVQVIYNLLDNAIKFTKEGTVEVIVEEQVGKVTVSVKDPGTGIDVNIFPRLFSKFVTKSFQGTGLGLFICKGIIEAHGGQIWAKNNSYDQGATFSFDLPAYETQEKQQQRPQMTQ